METLEDDVIAAINHLRTSALSVSVFDRYLSDGVLHQVGWALWEHPPESREGIGHENAMRVNTPTDYAATITPTAIINGALNEDDWLRVRIEHRSQEATIEYSSFHTHYNPNGAATSIVHQETVFSPEVGPSGAPTFHKCVEFARFAAAAAAESLGVYFNIGMGNDSWIWTGELKFNHRYAMEVRTRKDQPSAGIGGYMPTELWHIGTTRGRFIAADHVGVAQPVVLATKPWPHFIFDPTHPDVVKLCNAHVGDFVQRFRGQARGYFLRGECSASGGRQLRRTTCPGRITDANFDACAPVANFAPHALWGFKEYMRELLAGSVARLRERWHVDAPVTFDNIDLITPQGQWNAGHPQVAQDYMAYLTFLIDEIGVSHYLVARRAERDGWYAILSFAPFGVEMGGLRSDFAASGSYYLDEQTYFGLPDERALANDLTLEADAARLLGKPLAFPISAPPTTIRFPTTIAGAWYRACLKTVTPVHFRLWLREVLGAGIVHVAYVKAYVHGLIGCPTSTQSVNDGFALIRDLRQRALEFMGPYQRVAVHVERLDRIHRSGFEYEPSAVVGVALTNSLRGQQIPFAVFSDATLLERAFSRWQLQRSVVVVPFHAGVEADGGVVGKMLESYAELFDGDAGLAVLVVSAAAMNALRSAAGFRFAAAGRAARGSDFADYWRVLRPDGRMLRVLMFAFRDRAPAESGPGYLRACSDLVIAELPGWLVGAEVLARPVSTSAGSSTTRLSSNFVTDGLNSLIAVSWLARPSLGQDNVTVLLDQAWVSGFDPRFVTGFETTFHEGSSAIRPSETLFAYVEPRLNGTLAAAISGGGLQQVMERFAEVLGRLGNAQPPYEVGHGLAFLDKAAGALRRGHSSRALAALVLLSRAVFLSAQRIGATPTVDVQAVSVWHASGKPGVRPLAGAEVQAILPLNAHQAQARVRTNDAGRATVTVAPPFDKRWRFTLTPTFVEPTLAEVSSQIEVHVTDADTGAHTFVTV